MTVTEEQLRTLRAIDEYITEHGGESPSVGDVASRLGVIWVNALRRIDALRMRGLVNGRKHVTRTIKITALGFEALGRIEKHSKVERASFKCPDCYRTFFGDSHRQHVCDHAEFPKHEAVARSA